eukprot:3688673-Pyramimonas_sp.AAC.2
MFIILIGGHHQAHVELVDCHVRDNKGPGIDICDKATVEMTGCFVKGNVGGVFAWGPGAEVRYRSFIALMNLRRSTQIPEQSGGDREMCNIQRGDAAC